MTDVRGDGVVVMKSSWMGSGKGFPCSDGGADAVGCRHALRKERTDRKWA